jgi:hypothetical protein
MIPYTDEEQQWVSTGSYRRSNLNRQRRVKQRESQWYLPKHGYAIKTTIEVNGKTYVVPVQL